MAETAHIDPALVDAIGTARHVCVLTGAGISAESGVPTFRDAQQGLWARYDPHELATPEAFERDPDLVWRWYRWRRALVARAEPNAGHRALAALAEETSRLTLVSNSQRLWASTISVSLRFAKPAGLLPTEATSSAIAENAPASPAGRAVTGTSSQRAPIVAAPKFCWVTADWALTDSRSRKINFEGRVIYM